MIYPNTNEITKIIDKYHVPITIRKHLDKVTEVGVFLAKGMKKHKVEIDIELVRSGCLIHDAFKVVSLEKLEPLPEFNYIPTTEELRVHEELRKKYLGTHETLVAADILKDKYPEFSEFVANIGSTGNPTYMNENQNNFLELQVMHYADWRVQWDQIVNFGDRLNYLEKTYLHNYPDKDSTWWESMKEKELKIEKMIFDSFDFDPDMLDIELKRFSQS